MTISDTTPLHDVAVVGGGPAGAVCALLLARAGVRVALIVRRRDGPSCVELVSGRIRRRLEILLSRPLTDLLHGREIVETVSRWGGAPAAAWSALQNPYGYGLAVRRPVLDAVLMDAARSAGVEVIEGTEVRGAEFVRGRWELVMRSQEEGRCFRAGGLVLATGFSRQRLVPRPPVGKPPQVVYMLHIDTEFPERDHVLVIETVEDGWYYGLPDPEGGFFFGYCVRRGTPGGGAKRARIGIAACVAYFGLSVDQGTPGVLTGRLTGRPAGPLAYSRVCGEGWVAVGDAAFVSDPLSGMGIDFAVESAFLAADALLASDSKTALARYGDAVAAYARRHEQAGSIHHATRTFPRSSDQIG